MIHVRSRDEHYSCQIELEMKDDLQLYKSREMNNEWASAKRLGNSNTIKRYVNVLF